MPIPTARDLMTDRVLAARADWSLQELATFFTEHAISGAPVVSDPPGGVIGVVSLTDIARHDSEADAATETEEDEHGPPAYYLGYAASQRKEGMLSTLREHEETTVRDIMMPAIFTVEEDATVYKLADRMVRGRLHRLLVVRSGTKRDVVGIVTAIDLLEWIREERPSVNGTG